jgi:hypothetical protein
VWNQYLHNCFPVVTFPNFSYSRTCLIAHSMAVHFPPSLWKRMLPFVNVLHQSWRPCHELLLGMYIYNQI